MSEIKGRLGGPREPLQHELEERLEPNARGGRWLRRHLAGPVAALTTTEGPRYRAATISSLTQLSSDPPRFLISIEADSQMEGWLKQSGVCGLSFLPWEQQLLADRFAGLAPLADARFEDLPHFVAITGSPILSNAIGWADCRIVDQQSTGDHTLFVAEVVALGAGAARDQPPLIYYQNRYRTLR